VEGGGLFGLRQREEGRKGVFTMLLVVATDGLKWAKDTDATKCNVLTAQHPRERHPPLITSKSPKTLMTHPRGRTLPCHDPFPTPCALSPWLCSAFCA